MIVNFDTPIQPNTSYTSCFIQNDSKLSRFFSGIVNKINELNSEFSLLRTFDPYLIHLVRKREGSLTKRQKLLQSRYRKHNSEKIEFQPSSFYLHKNKYLSCKLWFMTNQFQSYVILGVLDNPVEKHSEHYKSIFSVIQQEAQGESLYLQIPIESEHPLPFYLRVLLRSSSRNNSKPNSGSSTPLENGQTSRFNFEISKQDIEEALHKEVSLAIRNGDFDFEEILQEEMNKLIQERKEESSSPKSSPLFTYCTIQ